MHPTRHFHLAVLVSTLACGSGDAPTATPNQRPADDLRGTADLAASGGNFRVHFTLADMVAPTVPLKLSIDGRAPDEIWLPLESKSYQLEPGTHQVLAHVGQTSCSLHQGYESEATVYSPQNVLILENGTFNYTLSLDCSSVLDTWAFKVTVLNEQGDPDGFQVTMSSPDFGTRVYDLPRQGSRMLGPTHVGWWKLRVEGIAPGCQVQGLGTPGTPHDSVQIRPHSGVIFYWVRC